MSAPRTIKLGTGTVQDVINALHTVPPSLRDKMFVTIDDSTETGGHVPMRAVVVEYKDGSSEFRLEYP